MSAGWRFTKKGIQKLEGYLALSGFMAPFLVLFVIIFFRRVNEQGIEITALQEARILKI